MEDEIVKTVVGGDLAWRVRRARLPILAARDAAVSREVWGSGM
jgi:hypothetical protein